MTSWRLIPYGRFPPALNMAIDEVMQESGGGIFRCYGWDPPGLSLGYFQKVTDAEIDGWLRRKWGVVRRVTGGGALLHQHELTFSLAVDEAAHPALAETGLSYDAMNRCLLALLAELGVVARPRGEDPGFMPDGVTKRSEAPFLCFLRENRYDLVMDRGKIVGTAQRRTGGRILHHGSLVTGPSDLPQGEAPLGSYVPQVPSWEELTARFVRQVARQFGITFETKPLTDGEISRAREIVKTKFGNRDWVREGGRA
mgnify:CR=1 FL=1